MIDISSLRDIKILKETDRQTLILTEDTQGTKYLKRVLSEDKREIYKSLKKISHPHIPKIYEVSFDSETVVLEEYVEAIPLSRFLAEGNPIHAKQLIDISKQLLYAMEILHSNNIIHKDIKPDNILIDSSYHVWLVDYDIARIYRKEIRRDTETVGTFGYAPIEQYGMFPTDFKTDIYAFGVTLQTVAEAVNYKGYLLKIAEKCKRFDPAERYQTVGEITKAITQKKISIMLVWLSIFVLIAILIFGIFLPKNSNIAEEQPFVTDENPSSTSSTKPNGSASFEGTFSGFEVGLQEAYYQESPYYSQICVFGMQSPWEHLIFTDDMTKTGQLKLGKAETVIDAEITLQNGELFVSLIDPNKKTFQHRFRFDGQYSYSKNYSDNLRNNADIICYDFNGDGATELLIGLNECSIGMVEKQFYCSANYSIAWCILYDENTGFQLCDGEMFAKRDSFWMNEEIRKLNVYWEDVTEPTGYFLKGDSIVSN